MDITQIVEAIFDLIKVNNILPGGNVITADTSLYDECGLSSVEVIDLVVCIEEQFDFEFNDTDLELTNFETVTNIAKLVKRKLSQE